MVARHGRRREDDGPLFDHLLTETGTVPVRAVGGQRARGLPVLKGENVKIV